MQVSLFNGQFVGEPNFEIAAVQLPAGVLAQALDVFMAGDDVPEKKPDPSIYFIAAKRLSVDPTECVVVEDSTIGLRVCSTPSPLPALFLVIVRFCTFHLIADLLEHPQPTQYGADN